MSVLTTWREQSGLSAGQSLVTAAVRGSARRLPGRSVRSTAASCKPERLGRRDLQDVASQRDSSRVCWHSERARNLTGEIRNYSALGTPPAVRSCHDWGQTGDIARRGGEPRFTVIRARRPCLETVQGRRRAWISRAHWRRGYRAAARVGIGFEPEEAAFRPFQVDFQARWAKLSLPVLGDSR